MERESIFSNMVGIKMLTRRERELFVTAVGLAVRIDSAYPDVGFSPSHRSIAQKLAASFTFAIDEADINQVCKDYAIIHRVGDLEAK